MKSTLNIMPTMFGNSNIFCMFVMRNRQNIASDLHVDCPALMAALFGQVYFGILDGFAKTQRRVAFFVLHTKQICSEMRNRTNLNQPTARGASGSTTNTRKRVTSSLKSYQVSLRTVGVFASDYKSGVYSTKIYQATSREEAIGMACDYIGSKFPMHTIMMNETECKQLKTLSL